MKTIRNYLISFVASALLLTQSAYAQSMLRDAETEAFLREITDPVLVAAGLTPENVHIYLIHDNSINAFVTGGQNIFIHSGLLLEVESVEQLLGVIAHETGHISGGHLRRGSEMARSAGNMSIFSMVLGAAAIAAGSSDAGMALIAGGTTFAQRSYLKYNRAQESAADQAAGRFLMMSETSGRGLIEFFEVLRIQENIRGIPQNEYIRSHPLNSDRMQALEVVVTESPFYDKPTDPILDAKLKRIQGKLYGYVRDTFETYSSYPNTDTSFEARYARTYAFHRDLEWDKALAEIDAMLVEDPFSPYLYEIKGQILVENHRVDEALVPLRRAVDIAPREPLILTALGQALVATENESHLRETRFILERATQLDRENTFGWYNLAIVYTRLNMPAHASLASAERYGVIGNARLAVMQANMAVRGLKEHSPEWLRAQDILYINQARAKKQEREEQQRRRREERGQR